MKGNRLAEPPIEFAERLHAPASSWWLCAPEEFTRRAQQEQARMSSSKFGRLLSVTYGPMQHPERISPERRRMG